MTFANIVNSMQDLPMNPNASPAGPDTMGCADPN